MEEDDCGFQDLDLTCNEDDLLELGINWPRSDLDLRLRSVACLTSSLSGIISSVFLLDSDDDDISRVVTDEFLVFLAVFSCNVLTPPT